MSYLVRRQAKSGPRTDGPHRMQNGGRQVRFRGEALLADVALLIAGVGVCLRARSGRHHPTPCGPWPPSEEVRGRAVNLYEADRIRLGGGEPHDHRKPSGRTFASEDPAHGSSAPVADDRSDF